MGRWAWICAVVLMVGVVRVRGQDGAAGGAAATPAVAASGGLSGGASGEIGLWPLFVQSLDGFTVLLLIGSLVAAWLITLRIMDLRPSVVLPESSVRRVDELLRTDRLGELRTFVEDDETMVSKAMLAALEEEERGAEAMLDAGEMAASEETARLYRSIDLLNVIGNLGPLVGLAGTVYGMILAFTSLSVTEGQAGPGDLSAGISKALFHTLLGLLLAIPCLTAYAVFRQMVDRTATRGMTAASRSVERLAARVHPPKPAGGLPTAPGMTLPPLSPFDGVRTKPGSNAGDEGGSA